MDIISLSAYLILALVVGVPILLILLFTGAMIFIPWYPMFKADRQTKRLLEIGISAPAQILSSKAGSASKTTGFLGGVTYRYRVNFDLQVNPKDHAPFQAKLFALVPSPEQELIGPGEKIWIRYDPGDITKISFEYFDADKMMLLEEDEWKVKRDEYVALDKKYQQLRASGEEALATIIEKEPIIDMMTVQGRGTIYRLKLEITPESGFPFQVETQAVMQINKKYAVGKKVFVRFDRMDQTMVALDRSAETIW